MRERGGGITNVLHYKWGEQEEISAYPNLEEKSSPFRGRRGGEEKVRSVFEYKGSLTKIGGEKRSLLMLGGGILSFFCFRGKTYDERKKKTRQLRLLYI